MSPVVVALLLLGQPGEPETAGAIDFEVARRHWAYRPITPPQLPVVKDRQWASSPIDRFVLARLAGSVLTLVCRRSRSFGLLRLGEG